ELGAVPARADPELEASSVQESDRGDLFRQHHRMAGGQHEDPGADLDIGRHRRRPRADVQRLQPRHAVQAGGVEQVVDGPQVDPVSVGLAREGVDVLLDPGVVQARVGVRGDPRSELHPFFSFSCLRPRKNSRPGRRAGRFGSTLPRGNISYIQGCTLAGPERNFSERSNSKPPPFAYYHRPTTLEEALDRLATDEGAVPLSGGQSLVPLLNMRLARPTTVVDLSSIPGLDSITSDEGSVTIGGKVTHAALERHAWPAGFEALTEGVKRIGYPAIRHKGTVGGSV